MENIQIESALICASDDVLRKMILSAQKRLAFIGTGMTEAVARALASSSSLVIYVFLDNSEENYRTGYGDVNSARILYEHKINIQNIRGVKTNILVVDDLAIIYSPLALVVEKDADAQAATGVITSYDAVRNIFIAASEALPSEGKETDLQAAPLKTFSKEITIEPITEEEIKENEQHIDETPIEKFDVQRKTRVYTNHIGFVEIETKGFRVKKHVLHIPSDLLEFSITDKGKINASYTIFDDDSKLVIWAKSLESKIESLKSRFTYMVPGYGAIYVKSKRKDINQSIKETEELIEKERREFVDETRHYFDKVTASVTELLLPRFIKSSFAAELIQRKIIDDSETDAKNYILSRLTRELGTPEKYIATMSINAIYKDIEYSMLKDENFNKKLFLHQDLKELFEKDGFMDEFSVVETSPMGKEHIKPTL